MCVVYACEYLVSYILVHVDISYNCNALACAVHFKLGEISMSDPDMSSSNLTFVIVVPVITAFIVCLLLAIGFVAFILHRRRRKENANVKKHKR